MAVANEGIYEDGKTIPITCANLVSILEDIALELLFVKRSPPSSAILSYCPFLWPESSVLLDKLME